MHGSVSRGADPGLHGAEQPPSPGQDPLPQGQGPAVPNAVPAGGLGLHPVRSGPYLPGRGRMPSVAPSWSWSGPGTSSGGRLPTRRASLASMSTSSGNSHPPDWQRSRPLRPRRDSRGNGRRGRLMCNPPIWRKSRVGAETRRWRYLPPCRCGLSRCRETRRGKNRQRQTRRRLSPRK